MSVWVYVCNGTRTEVTNIDGTESARCSPAGDGAWTQVESLSVPFDPASLSPETLSEAFGAGFISMASLLIVIWAAKLLVETIKGA